ncbi:hypothetical protein D3C76_884620 [compost metagenome]
MDALPGRAADARGLAGAGFRIGVDVHARNAQALASQGRGVGGQVLVGSGAHRGDRWNRHPGLQAPQVAAGVGVFGHHHVEHLEQVRHGPGERHDDVHGRRQRPVATHRDHPARRRVGAQAIVGGRATTARPGFFSQAEGGKAGGGGGSGTVRRAGGEGGGEVVGVVRAFCAAVDATLHAAVGHRRHIGLAQADGAGGAQPFDSEGIATGDQVLEGRAAGGCCQPLDQITVLGRVGNAIERAQGLALGAPGIAGLGLLQRLGVAHHDRIERGGRLGRVVGIDPREIGLDQLHGGGLAGFERSAQLGYGNFGDFDHAVTAGC